MDFLNKKSNLINETIRVAQHAGTIVLEIYNQSGNFFKLKEDNSPLTKADTASNNYIVNQLKNITPDIPILSEEEKSIPLSVRSEWKEYWLIDPLDGTKEFIKRNGEFTVNIALIRNNRPIFGVIDIPTKQQTFWGAKDLGSFMLGNNKEKKKLKVSANEGQKIKILTSRTHPGFENLIIEEIDNVELIVAGSSMKFCLIANGVADGYIRLGPTSEWDIAAGEAIVKFAGGITVDIENRDIIYNKSDNLINPHFVVTTNNKLANKLLKLINR